MKYKAGDVIEPITLKTAKGETITIPDPSLQFTHVQFNRWCGDPIGDQHVTGFRKAYQRIRDRSVQEVVFFYSDNESIETHYTQVRLHMIGDPAKTYYKMFGVETSSKWLMKKKAWSDFVKGIGLHHFNFKAGKHGMNGLPADFLIAKNGKICACRYGLHGSDQWEVNEMLFLAQTFDGKTAIEQKVDDSVDAEIVEDVVTV
jgi:hypothetical protein